MSSLDSVDLFSSGPHSFSPTGWQRDLVRRSYAGLDGETIVDMGRRGRTIEQTGRLAADTAAELETLIGQVASYVDGQTHILIDNHSLTYQTVILELFELTGPIRTGRCFWCQYTIRYRQLS